MSNSLEYVFSLRDKFSNNLNKIQIATEKQFEVFSKLQLNTFKATDSVRQFGGSISSLKEKLDVRTNNFVYFF